MGVWVDATAGLHYFTVSLHATVRSRAPRNKTPPGGRARP
ncbi:MAG: hypothetical protein QOF52_2375, partial [Propionibacteriaceae bacterium]|nr:hypothetical protein [Propionibacteriaceae bacterium]